jgi:hypothetical protein
MHVQHSRNTGRRERGQALAEGAGFLVVLIPVAIVLTMLEMLLVSYGFHILEEMKTAHATDSGVRWTASAAQWLGMNRQNFDPAREGEMAIRASLKENNLPWETQGQNSQRYAEVEITVEDMNAGVKPAKRLIKARTTVHGLSTICWVPNYTPGMTSATVHCSAPLMWNNAPNTTAIIKSPPNTSIAIPAYVFVGGLGGPGWQPDYRLPNFYNYRADSGDLGNIADDGPQVEDSL